MSMFSSSRRSCRTSYIFLIVNRNVSVTSQSFRKSTLYLVLVLLFIYLFFSFIFTLARNRLWSEAVSAPLCTLRSCIDLLNFCPVQIWSIWFSVLWSDDVQDVFFCVKIHYLLFSVVVPSPRLPMTSSYPLLFAPIFALKSPMSIIMSFSFILSSTVCSML